MKQALVAGWFSFEGMGATAGDILARDLCLRWLGQAGVRGVAAVAPPFSDGIDWQTADPAAYDAVIFVCGPFGNGWPLTDLLARFAGRPFVGLDVSVLQPLEEWDPFDALVERDSSRTSRPDITLISDTPGIPVVGVILVHPQSEYDGGMHAEADGAISRVLDARDIAQVRIDTRLDVNGTGLRTARQVESLIARMDAVVTTRLHGTVLSIKHGVPPLVIDPIAGGRKVIRQARTLGWSRAYVADRLDERVLGEALDYCLSSEGRAEAVAVRERSVALAIQARDEFISAVAALVA